ncbi:hypothetical protein HBI56_043380 [Parastagonospora nodorum]|nr:hypothetical protein HBH51_008140 [Parastagonospora nodorum]KAH4004902.1 hypothetical protein HBI10_046670 [Parastagonospora nodorum]KAH4031203.1 hypothetical protein HBI13_030130 [Parastagonospora nodorum]KAH4259741.1 hypothetical protein HBI04_212770 [Parastagonospora nodorum]KAH4272461.1 hypothetical protein HBI03_029150 [Parastagonospora nodorum]
MCGKFSSHNSNIALRSSRNHVSFFFLLPLESHTSSYTTFLQDRIAVSIRVPRRQRISGSAVSSITERRPFDASLNKDSSIL